MPVIPVGNEAQVLNAGSPVPVASSESARAMGEAVAGLGRGMFQLGDAMDVAAKNVKSRQDKLDLNSALAKYELERTKAIAELERAKPTSGPDSKPFDNIQMYQDKGKEIMNSIAEGLGGDVQQEFLAAATKNLAEDSMSKYGQEVKKYDDQGNVKWQRTLSDLTSSAYIDPGNAGKRMYMLEAGVQSIPDVPDWKRNELELQGKKAIAQAAIDGYLNAPNPNYGAATHALNTLYAGYFTEEDRRKQNKDIQDVRWGNQTRSWQVSDRLQKEAKEAKEAQMDYYTQETMAYMSNATNERERQAILGERAYQAFASGVIDEQRFKFLTSTAEDSLAKIDDGPITLGIFDKVDEGWSPRQARNEVMKQAAEGRLSKAKAEQLWKTFKDMEERMQRDPLYSRKISEAISYIKGQASSGGFMDDLTRKMYGKGPEADKAYKAVDSFLTKTMAGKDITAARNEAIHYQFGDKVKPQSIPGVEYNQMDSDQVIVFKTQQMIKAQKLSPAEANRRLKLMESVIEQRNKEKQMKQEEQVFKQSIKTKEQGQ